MIYRAMLRNILYAVQGDGKNYTLWLSILFSDNQFNSFLVLYMTSCDLQGFKINSKITNSSEIWCGRGPTKCFHLHRAK